MRLACSNAEAAFADMIEAIGSGVREGELVGIGVMTLCSLGADETREFVCASGPRTNLLGIDFTGRQVRPI